MLGAVLGDFQGKVGGIHDVLTDAGDFVAEDEGVLASGFAPEGAQFFRMDGLLHRHHRVAVGLEAADGLQGVIDMLPGDGILGAEGRFVDLRGGRNRRNAAQKDFVDTEGIGRPEGAAHVVRTADVVQHDDESGRRKFLVLRGRNPAQFDVEKFSVFHGGKVKKKTYLCGRENQTAPKPDTRYETGPPDL